MAGRDDDARDRVVGALVSHRGTHVTLHFRDGEVTRSQILWVDDHLYHCFCHRILETNRPEKHGGAYQADTSWVCAFDRVERVEPDPEGPPAWKPVG
ncbi:MAG: hypothetical protein L0216_10490 [Planctomycetales bacterium]|nr:hypothetical protein [Planctomycetales bacterium]